MVSGSKLLLSIMCSLVFPLSGMDFSLPLLGQLDPGVPDEVYRDVILPLMICDEGSVSEAHKKLCMLRTVNRRWASILTDNSEKGYTPILNILASGLSQKVKDIFLQDALKEFNTISNKKNYFFNDIIMALNLGADVNQSFSMSFLDKYTGCGYAHPVTVTNPLLLQMIYCLYNHPKWPYIVGNGIYEARLNQGINLINCLLDSPSINVNIVDDLSNSSKFVGYRGFTPLMLMVDLGIVNLVEKIISKGANLEMMDTDKNTVLCRLIKNIALFKEKNASHKKATYDIPKCIQILNILVDAGAQVNVSMHERDHKPVPLLQYAMQKADDEIVRILLSGADVDLQGHVVSRYENYDKYKDDIDAAREKPARIFPERIIFVPAEPVVQLTHSVEPVTPVAAVVPVQPALIAAASSVAPDVAPVVLVVPVTKEMVKVNNNFAMPKPSIPITTLFSSPAVWGSVALVAAGCAYYVYALYQAEKNDDDDEYKDDESERINTTSDHHSAA